MGVERATCKPHLNRDNSAASSLHVHTRVRGRSAYRSGRLDGIVDDYPQICAWQRPSDCSNGLFLVILEEYWLSRNDFDMDGFTAAWFVRISAAVPTGLEYTDPGIGNNPRSIRTYRC